MLAVGLMSGTSADGIDAALVEIRPRGESYRVELVRFATWPFEPELRVALAAALPPRCGSVAAVAGLHVALGRAFGAAAGRIAGNERIAFVASHGQTMWHDGPAHVTLQLGDAFAIREAAGATVCYDFRSADTAAGGHGAPLMAHVDTLLLRSATEDRVALNLGGIASLTLLRAGVPSAAALAFDAGPGNMLVDALVLSRTNGARRFDEAGALARAGRVDESLLRELLADEYFAAPAPKTTGRERFGEHFLDAHRQALARLSIEDAAATLTELTVAAIGDAVEAHGFARARIVASGGGVHNATMLKSLAQRLPNACVEASDAMGIPADAKEALGFVVLAYELLRERTGNVVTATGARRPVLLGAIAPHRLRSLLDEVTTECAESA